MAEKLVRIGETDAYVFATERQMRTRQGHHVSCSVLELEARPDLEKLKLALVETMRRHPILAATAGRPAPFTRLWYVKSGRPATSIPFQLWTVGKQSFQDSKEIPSFDALTDYLLNDAGPFFEKPVWCNARVDMLCETTAGWKLILSWRHIVLDGIGAEWLLREIAALCEDCAAASVAPSFSVPGGSPRSGMHERWKATKPMLDHLMGIMKRGIHSLARRSGRVGRVKFHHKWLTADESAAARKNATKICGPLIQTPFFLACAVRAHDAVWRKFRGGPPDQYVVALPVQERARGKPGPIFRNNVSVMFLQADSAHGEDVEALTRDLLHSQQQMMRARLADSFAEMQRWMMLLPGPLYTLFLKQQMKGETTSFHHSHTGSFAGGLEFMAGSRILNAFHIPGFYAPPGTGLFVSEHQGRMTVTASWREGVLTPGEASFLEEVFVQSLTGEILPHGNL